MLNDDLIKEFIFDCRMKRYSERTIKGYLNNNLGLFKFISNEYGIEDVEETVTAKAVSEHFCKSAKAYSQTVKSIFLVWLISE